VVDWSTVVFLLAMSCADPLAYLLLIHTSLDVTSVAVNMYALTPLLMMYK
jgi:hypothetical protein